MSLDSIPGNISANKNLNFLMSVKVNLDSVLIRMALIKSSLSISKVIYCPFMDDRCSKISLPATDNIVFNALKPQS